MKETEHEKTLKEIAYIATSSIACCIYHWVEIRNMDVLGGSQSVLVEWVWNEEGKKYLPSDECLNMILATGIIANHMTNADYLEWKVNNEYAKEKLSEEIHKRFWQPTQSEISQICNIVHEKPAC